MLLKIERKILKATSSKKGNTICLSEIGKYDGEIVYQTFIGLQEKGYFNLVDTSIDRSNFSYALSAKGKFYKENFKLQLLKNIIIPFLVALLTALATHRIEKAIDEYTTHRTSQGGYELNDSPDEPFPLVQ